MSRYLLHGQLLLFAAVICSCSQQPDASPDTAEPAALQQAPAPAGNTDIPAGAPIEVADVAPTSEEVATDAESVLRRLAEFYQQCRTVQVESEQVMTMNGPGINNQMAITRRIAAARPNRISILHEADVPVVDVVSDGETLVIYRQGTELYDEIAAPESFDLLMQDPSLAEQESGPMPFALNLLADDPYELMLEPVVQTEYIGREDVDGTNAHRIRLVGENSDQEVWVQAEGDPLLLQVSADMSKLLQQFGSPAGMEMTAIEIFRNWTLDAPLDAQVFSFTAGPGVRRRAIVMDRLEEVWTAPGVFNGVAVASDTGHIYASSAAGKCTVLDGDGQESHSFSVDRNLSLIRPAELNAEPGLELLATSRWGQSVVAIGGDGAELWNETGGQGVDDVWAADLDEDGRDEVIVGYNGGTGLHVFSHNGERRWSTAQIGNVWHVAAGDVTGDGATDVVTTSATGQIHLFDAEGNPIRDLRVPLYASMVRVGIAAEDDDTNPIFVIGSGDAAEQMIAIDASGDIRWTLDFPAAAEHCDSMMLAAQRPWAAAGFRGGLVIIVDTSQGTILATISGLGERSEVAWRSGESDAIPLLVVASGRDLKALRVSTGVE